MSITCHHPSWPNILKNLQPSSIGTRSCWKVIKSESSFMETHAGIFNANGRVISKMGTRALGITDHEIHHVPIQLGREIMFFRKGRT